MTEREIRAAATAQRWTGMDSLIASAKRVHGEEDWERAFTDCEDCGQLVIDPAVHAHDGAWNAIEVESAPHDSEGYPTGLPVLRFVCDECMRG